MLAASLPSSGGGDGGAEGGDEGQRHAGRGNDRGRQYVHPEVAVRSGQCEPAESDGKYREPGDGHRLRPKRPISRGATVIMISMVTVVIGCRAPQLAKAPKPSTCCR